MHGSCAPAVARSSSECRRRWCVLVGLAGAGKTHALAALPALTLVVLTSTRAVLFTSQTFVDLDQRQRPGVLAHALPGQPGPDLILPDHPRLPPGPMAVRTRRPDRLHDRGDQHVVQRGEPRPPVQTRGLRGLDVRRAVLRSTPARSARPSATRPRTTSLEAGRLVSPGWGGGADLDASGSRAACLDECQVRGPNLEPAVALVRGAPGSGDGADSWSTPTEAVRMAIRVCRVAEPTARYG